MPKAAKTPKGEVKEKRVRAPSAYNLFIKSELAKIKAAKPGIVHADAFKQAAAAWATSSQNPKNKKK